MLVVLVKTALFFYLLNICIEFIWYRVSFGGEWTFSIITIHLSVPCTIVQPFITFSPHPNVIETRVLTCLFLFTCRTRSMPLIVPLPTLLHPLLEVKVPGMLMVLKMCVSHFLVIIPNTGFISECWQYSGQSPLVSYLPSWNHCSPSSPPLNLHHFYSSVLVITCLISQSSL